MNENKLSLLDRYHEMIRKRFNHGNNRYCLNINEKVNWLFDRNAVPIKQLKTADKWLRLPSFSSVFVASKKIEPLKPNTYIQRTGVCLIESVDLREMIRRSNSGNCLSEEDALKIIESYPSESQLLGVKPLLKSDVIVFLEDKLFEEFWDRFTDGRYDKSRKLRNAFREQMERTKESIRRYVKLIHPEDTPKIEFIYFSDIWESLRKNTEAWIRELWDILPYEGEEKFYIPNAAFVLYTYGVKGLADVCGLDKEKDFVIVRQLTHCVLEKTWLNNKSKVMDWFRDAVVEYFKRYPKLMIGYFDLYDNKTSCSFMKTPLKEKVCRRKCHKEDLLEAVKNPLPLCENKVFQRGIVLDFDTKVIEDMLEADRIYSEYCKVGRPKEKRPDVRKSVSLPLMRIYKKYCETIFPILGCKDEN
jgi:hypothetical protein